MVSFAPSTSSMTSQPTAIRADTRFLLRQPPALGVPIEKSARPLPAANLAFKDLAFTAKLPDGDSKVILEPCSGHFEAGHLVALMGPSGSGKSTLLDMLAMKKTAKYQGVVKVNGHDRDTALFSRIAAYVGQEDCMPAHWTVREALEFNASLKRQSGDAESSSGSRRVFIDTLLDAFGLAEVAGTYIGGAQVRGVSGGQRRRVTLARGVAAHASILFCDEPTSGLSATDAELCIKALRVIAKRFGVLVVVVIHQPRREVAQLFDMLLLLTSNPGRMAYLGAMEDAPAYFEECGHPVPSYANPTDLYLDLLTPGAEHDASDALVEAFADHQRPALELAVEDALATTGLSAAEMISATHDGVRLHLGPYSAPYTAQLRALLRRKVRLTMRNPAGIGMQLLMPAMMGCVLGTVFQGIGHQAFGASQIMFVFILLTMLSLQSLPLMTVLIEERAYMKHETSERLYKDSAHILTTALVTVPLSLLGATIQTLIIYAFSGMPYDYLPTILGWTLLCFFLFDALFQCVAAVAPDGEQAITMATPWLVVFMLFNGAVVTRATAPVYLRWVFGISPTFYALQAIVTRMAGDAGASGQMLVNAFGYKEGENMTGLAVIVTMTVVLRALQVVFLKYLNNVQK